jgi:hypothetical protein
VEHNKIVVTVNEIASVIKERKERSFRMEIRSGIALIKNSPFINVERS